MLKSLFARIARLFVRAASYEVFCRHDWRTERIEEITEKYRYNVTEQCRKCGKLFTSRW